MRVAGLGHTVWVSPDYEGSYSTLPHCVGPDDQGRGEAALIAATPCPI